MTVARQPRVSPPECPAGEIAIAAPPQPPRPARRPLLARLLPVALAAAMVPMMALAYRPGSATSATARNPALLVFPLLMLISAGTGALGGRRGSSDLDADRDDYLGYLSALREQVAETTAAQHSSLIWCHPPPEALWTLVGGPRMWERQPGDADFGQVRVGVGLQPLATRLVPSQADRADSTARVDPVTDTALQRFLDTHSTVPDVPVMIALPSRAGVVLDGDPDAVRGLMRALICQLAVLHGPDLLLVAAVVAARNRRHWDWLKWLPHHQHPSATDNAGPARMTYPSLTAAEAALAGCSADRRVVVVVDSGATGLTMIEAGAGLAGPEATAGLRLQVTATTLTGRRPGGEDMLAQPDSMSAVDALVCARRLAAYRPDQPAGSERSGGWPDLLGIDDATAVGPNTMWQRENTRERLCIPIGTASSGEVVRLDIKEAAEHGTGPHGLCIGATGSGKSELLRTIALGMIARHSPETLNLVLVDFKGGATFLGLERARHVAAIITNLADEAPLVDRMRDALAGEINRRQELLRAAGNFVSAAAYQAARQAGAPLAALPALLVIVDEFSELLSQHPDFVDVFVAIGRLGRSLGVHLLLASQRLDEGRLRGLESHLSYRV